MRNIIISNNFGSQKMYEKVFLTHQDIKEKTLFNITFCVTLFAVFPFICERGKNERVMKVVLNNVAKTFVIYFIFQCVLRGYTHVGFLGTK